MKNRAWLLVLLIMAGSVSHAYAGRVRHRYKGLPRSEGELVARVLNCLQNQDTIGYFNMFPPFDTLWHMVMHNPDNSPEAQHELNQLKEHPRTLVEFDPYYNPVIMDRFSYVLQKGTDSGISWSNVVLARFELQKEEATPDLRGLDKVATERFMGYVFVRDIGERETFCITITEIQKFQGLFVGGQVNNIMEASTIEEYNRRVEYERNYVIRAKIAEDDSALIAAKRDSLRNDSVKKGWLKLARTDSLKNVDSAKLKKTSLLNANIADDDTLKIRREVVERKYYEGKFDDEIPVELYVRYMKNVASNTVMYWDALYKFGDQKNYIKLDVTKTGDKWEFDDDPPVGSMELYLKNRIYTGSWVNNESQSGYDVVLKEAPIAPHKLEKLDKILEEGLSGRTDEPSDNDKTGESKKTDDNKKGRKSKKASRSRNDDDD